MNTLIREPSSARRRSTSNLIGRYNVPACSTLTNIHQEAYRLTSPRAGGGIIWYPLHPDEDAELVVEQSLERSVYLDIAFVFMMDRVVVIILPSVGASR